MNLFKGIKEMFSKATELNTEIWNALDDPNQVESVIVRSEEQPQLIYKHSNRCSVCLFAKSELENASDDLGNLAEMNYVDVIGSREVSDKIAERLGVRHESPQAILLIDGDAVWHASHSAVKSDKLLETLKSNQG